MLDKSYEPRKYEDDIYKRWEASGFFAPEVHPPWIDNPDDPKRKSFSIVLPPPNVTGILHIGHAVMLAIEDVMIRYHRMKGDRTLWIPGTDHAAIATQEKVEKLMFEKTEKTRHDLGRKKFLQKVDKFAKESHDTIVRQSKKMGTSMDWGREAFTLDEPRNFAVRTAFKKMYDDGLIYRGHRIVNWDPKMQSTVSDDEVDRKEEKVSFYTFKYGPFEISTARPETKFGDKYVVMHPSDLRYKQYKHGDTFDCEWINGKITATIIKDEAVDPEFGTGVMTITPWHDATDFGIAERHDLDREQIIDFDGKLKSIAGDLKGLGIDDARMKIVKILDKKGLLVNVDKDYVHNIALNSRGEGVIEPQIMEQWFVDVNKKFKIKNSKLKGIKSGQIVTLKSLMQEVVKNKQIEILPDHFNKTYFHWIDNLRDWCISRQIWYGHRVPAYYHIQETLSSKLKTQNCIDPIVSVEEIAKCVDCGKSLVQDEDTLDTWFSSGLWTFSTLGWPDDTDDLKNFHPTSVLETGYDILFFWVARMILMSTYLRGEVPFETVYLHGLVRDETGRKMSKSLNNIIDPLDVSEKFGTDAVRLSLMIGSTPGSDSKLSEEKIGSYRNFANKLWNIARFIISQLKNPNSKILTGLKPVTLADKWILSRLNFIIEHTTKDIEGYNFSVAGERLRDFTWNELADWYLEIAKIEGKKDGILNYVLNTVLKLWHPYMPFVTEVIWQEVYGEESMLMVEKWPEQTTDYRLQTTDFDKLKEIVTGIRSIRADYKIEPTKKLSVVVKTKAEKLIEENKDVIVGLSRLSDLTIGSEKPGTSVSFVVGGAEVYIDLAGAVDVEKEKNRLQKEIDNATPFVKTLEKKLANKKFVDNAPKKVVEQEKRKLAEAKERLEKLKSQLASIS